MHLTPEVADRIIAAAVSPEESLKVTSKARQAANELATNAAREVLCGLDRRELDRVLFHFNYFVDRGEDHFGERDEPIWMVNKIVGAPLQMPFDCEDWAYDAAINDLLDGTSGAWILTEIADGELIDGEACKL